METRNTNMWQKLAENVSEALSNKFVQTLLIFVIGGGILLADRCYQASKQAEFQKDKAYQSLKQEKLIAERKVAEYKTQFNILKSSYQLLADRVKSGKEITKRDFLGGY